jgi:hypothetical protein
MESREFSLVTKLARKTLDEEARHSVGALISTDFDWPLFFKLVYVNRVTALVYRNLRQLEDLGVPDHFMTWIGARVEKIAASNRLRETILEQISREFAKTELPFLLLKGPALAHAIYGDPLLRQYSDLDILLHASDIERAIQTLDRLGFLPPAFNRTEQQYLRRHHFEIALENEETGVMIDLHWALTPPSWPVKPNHADLWTRPVEIELGGTRMSTLEPDIQLFYLVVHAAKDGWHRLRMLCDLAELIRGEPDWNWEQTLAHAEENGGLRMVLISVLLISRLLETPIPDWVKTRAVGDAKALEISARIVRHLAIADEKKGKPSSIFVLSAFQLSQFDRRWDRLSYAVRTSLRPRMAHVTFIRLPPRLISLYPMVKILHDFVMMPPWRGMKALYARSVARSQIRQDL